MRHLSVVRRKFSNCSLAESVAELPADNAKVPHAASSSGLPSDSFDGPVVLANTSRRESTRGASLLLNVERDLSTPATQRVSFIPPFSKGAGSLSHSYTEMLSLVEVNQAIL